MAVKKNTEVEETLIETDAEVEDTVPYRLPRNLGQNAVQEKFFSVNFKNYLIKTGETVNIPRSVYNLIKDNEASEEEAQSFIDEHPLNEG